MSHLSWYRKYRPQTFDDVVGQSHIERTLRNAVAEGAVSHAYLFTGPRGTGKTTTARLLAKALNCAQGPTSEPDDTCEQCRLIAEGGHPDVYELDAASRTGVDAVREEIIGRVNYHPTMGTWKVYIIDEVQMLSTSAFNALLKTLEEPPARTVFILCTTHPHKVPETIHSRCQRFDFHRLGVADIAERLRMIADAEGVTVSDGALALIAKHALGGMRDAIATLEQLAAFTSGSITIDDVEGLLGEVSGELLFEAAELIYARDIGGAFRFVARLAEAGIDMSEFVKGMVGHFRDVFVLAAVGADEAVDTTSEDRARLQRQAQAFGPERAGRVLDVLGRLVNDLRWASDQRLTVEVALVRMVRPEGDLTLEALAERVAALESGAVATMPASPPSLSGVREAAPHRDVESGAARGREAGRSEPEPSVPPPAAESAGGRLDPAAVKRAWPAVRAEFKQTRPSRSHLFDGSEIEVAGDTLIIEFPADQAFSLELARDSETLAHLRRSVSSVIGLTPPIEFRLGRSGTSSTEPCAPETVEPAPAAAHPADAELTDPAALDRRVIDELGAELIVEHPHPVVELEPEGER